MEKILITKEQYITLYNRVKEKRSEVDTMLRQTELKENYFTNDELMVLLHISRRTFQRWRSMRLLPYVKIGKKIFYLSDSILDFFRMQSCNAIQGGLSPPPEDDGPDTEFQMMECLRCPLFVILNS